ncbi:MAG: Rrf2 family transcriptional regulator [Deltaproteobacteria bacterium]|nr:Rrf2 family transcriptional regulator [Deltaproteobacteria bacterium]
MKLGKESRYAIDGLLVLAKKRSGTIMQLQDIADAAGALANFLAKTFQKLNRANIVTSSRGAVRGYALARQPNALKVKDIFVAVEGTDIFDRCLFWSDRCADESPCPMHFRCKPARRTIAGLMQRMTLADLAADNRRR